MRGGIALHASKIWPFIRQIQQVEFNCFGFHLSEYGKELKGSHLLDKKRLKWAFQDLAMPEEERRKLCRTFLQKGLEHRSPTRQEFSAYGQACLEMARGCFQLLVDNEATLFASMIPRDVQKPEGFNIEEFLRKDQVFLLERFFYFLEIKSEHGLLVMDETERMNDGRFVRRLENYFTKTQTGRYRSQWIVPSPIFATSHMSYPVQVADLVIYCVNWGFRLPSLGINGPLRSEIAEQFGAWLNRIQFRGEIKKEGINYQTYGIVFVPDPYSARSSRNEL